MDDHAGALGPVYATASGITYHHGQLWTATPPEYLAYLNAELDFRPADVWLLSYPRSGTAWSHEVLSAVLYGGDIAALTHAQHDGRIPKFQPIEIGIGTAADLAGRIGRWKALPSPRVFPTHVPCRLFSNRVRALKCKRVYIVRDPRDVAVSRYHFHRSNRLLGPYQGTWDEFFDAFLSGQVTYGSWFEHTLGWWRDARANPADVFVMTYERLKTDTATTLRRLGSFLGRPLSEAAVAAIVEHTSFDRMSVNPFTNRAGNPIMVAPFLRKGVVGDWQQHFTPAQAARFQAIWHEKMCGSGIEDVMAL